MRAVKLNVPRTLKFKQAEYSSRTRKSRRFFTKVALKEGPVDPEELVEAYINANRALFNTQKDMTQNISAAKLLKTKSRDIYSSLERLSKKDLEGILDIQISSLNNLMNEKHISLELDSKAKSWLVEKGFDPVYGARPLRRVLQNHLQNPLAEKIITEEIKEGSEVKVSANDFGLSIKAA